MYLNDVTLMGHIGKEPERSQTESGRAYTDFSLCEDAHGYKDKDSGEWQDNKQWHRIRSWSGLADYAAGFKSGAHVLVKGRIRYFDYEKDGVKQRGVEIVASEIRSVRGAEGRKNASDPQPDAEAA